MKRGLTCLEAIDYVGVKRRTFDTQWRPNLVAMSQATSLIFDREDLDKLFNESKQNAGRSGIACRRDSSFCAGDCRLEDHRAATSCGGILIGGQAAHVGERS